MNILSMLEGWAKSIWGDAVTVEQAVVSRVENGVTMLLNDAKGLFGKFTADEYTLFRAFGTQALHDVQTGNIADLETATLMLAEHAGVTFVADLGSPVIQAALALLVVNGAPSPITAPLPPPIPTVDPSPATDPAAAADPAPPADPTPPAEAPATTHPFVQ